MGLCASKPVHEAPGAVYVVAASLPVKQPACQEGGFSDSVQTKATPLGCVAGSASTDQVLSATFTATSEEKACQGSQPSLDGLPSLEHAASAGRSSQGECSSNNTDKEPVGEVMFNPEALEAGAKGLPHDVAAYGAPRAPNEEVRMATIKALRHMGADSCAELDNLLQVICSIWDASVSSVTLLDSEHVWMCNAMGTGAQRCHKPWAVAMCPWTLLTPNPMTLAVGDLAEDARFNGNCHHNSGVTSYLTAPLVASNGHRLGAICFVDGKARKFNAGDARLMSNFAELAVREIEKHVNLAERLKQPEEVELAAVYQSRVRDVDDIADTCIMLVDTSVAGWRLVYVSPTWEDWTGVGREECRGKTLNELLEYVHGDREEAVIWQGVERDAREYKPFVTPKVCVKRHFGKAGPWHHAFYLSFKAAAVDPLDCGTVPVGVPSWLPMNQDGLISRYYFARLHTVPNPPPNSRVTFNLSRNSHSSAHSAARRDMLKTAANQLEMMSPVLAAASMFKGLLATHILGQGAFGTVWHATWHDSSVALKVVNTDVTCQEDLVQVKAEQQVGIQLVHINIVRTLAHASSIVDAPSRHSASHIGNTDAALTSGASWATTEDEPVILLPVVGGTSRWVPMQQDDTAHSNKTHATCVLTDMRLTPAPAVTPSWPMPTTPPSFTTGSPPAVLQSVVPQTLGELTCTLSAGGEVMPPEEPPPDNCLPPERLQVELPTYQGPTWHAVGALDAIEGKTWGQALENAPAGPPDVPPTAAASGEGGEEEETRLRRYSSGGLLGRWRRSTEATIMHNQDEPAFPYTLRQWVVIEYCDRGCLNEAIDRGDMRVAHIHSAGPALAAVVCNALDIARGLVYLHGKGVVHGDLTAVNVLLKSCAAKDLLPGDPRGYQAKLSDFGMSHMLEEASESLVAATYGAMTHMAPEVLTDRLISFKGDMYSLGVIMWQMMTGSRPWAGLSHLQVVIAVGHEHRQLQWPAQPPGSPADRLTQLGQQCCEPDPDNRPTAEEAAKLLEELAPAVVALASSSASSHTSSAQRVWVIGGGGAGPARPLD